MPSESEIISNLRRLARTSDAVPVGIGDDAAVISGIAGKDLLACCDLMVEGVHFCIDWASPRLIGRKALAVNLSDIAAMGGVPRFALISAALPHKCSEEFVSELFAGIFQLADDTGVLIVGGDTSSSRDSIFIDVSVIGECDTGKAITRGGAKPGNIIYVTGSLGGSALGLMLVEQGLRLNVSSSRDDDPRQQAVLRHLSPEPQLKFGCTIGEAGLATAMIDISDGLSTDLWHILDESNCGAAIQASAIPIANCVRRVAPELPGIDPLKLALNSGEEYELLLTASPENHERIFAITRKLDVSITAIGEIVAGKQLQLNLDNEVIPIEPSGYQHLI